MSTHLTEEAARALLARWNPATEGQPYRATRATDFWFFTYDPDAGFDAPLGAPSWIVLDTGQCGGLAPMEDLAEALRRVRSSANGTR